MDSKKEKKVKVETKREGEKKLGPGSRWRKTKRKE